MKERLVAHRFFSKCSKADFLSALAVVCFWAALESGNAVQREAGLSTAAAHRLTFLWAFLIYGVFLTAGGWMFRAVLDFLIFKRLNSPERYPSFLRLVAAMLSIALFLPVGLFINMRYFGAALSPGSLFGSAIVFILCALFVHLAFLIWWLVTSRLFPGRNRQFHSALGLGVIAVSLLSGIAAKNPAMMKQPPGIQADSSVPNVVVLTLDTVRADHILPGREPGARLAPNLNAFFQQGMVFQQAYVPYGSTIPSHASLFTGLYPFSHGVYTNRYRLGEQTLTLAERLKMEGYRTAAFISSYVLAPGGSGLHRGFEVYDHNFFSNPFIPAPAARLSLVHILARAGFLNLLERDAKAVTDRVLKWLKKTKDPFFLWIHYWDPHRPYAPPPEYIERVSEDYEGEIPVDSYGLMMRPPSFWESRREEAEHLRRLYAQEIQYMDKHIGRVFEQFDRQGLVENTFFIVLADHGEGLGEKGRYFMHESLYEFDVRVPFYLRLPGKYVSGKQEKVADVEPVVEIVDVIPTLLEMLDLDWKAEYDLQGRSLGPLLNGGTAEWGQEALFSSMHWKGLRQGSWKWFIDSEDREHLYRLTEDPEERNNLADSEQEQARKMSESFNRLLEEMADVSFEPETHVDPEAIERLKQLGYLGDT